VLEYPRRAPVAQLDRASDFESAGRPFESGQARTFFSPDFSYSGMSLEAVSSVSFRVTINFPAF
jgi:hypothetical protein